MTPADRDDPGGTTISEGDADVAGESCLIGKTLAQGIRKVRKVNLQDVVGRFRRDDRRAGP